MPTLPIPPALAVAVFLTIWFTLLFTVLPIGVRTQAEAGEVPAGTDPGAPVAPRMLMKVIVTTAISIVAFVVLVMVMRVLG